MSRHHRRFVLILLTAGLAPAIATAQSGTWITNTAGTYNWSLTGDWQNGTVADGANNTATFATAGLTGDITVNLDTVRTIGALVFDNPTNTFGWTITGSNILTLSNSASGGPTINVNKSTITATIAAPLAGTQGFTKTGSGTLSLTGTNTYSGGTTISDGTLAIAGDASLGAGPVSFSALGTLLYSATTSTTRSLALGGGEVDGASGAVVTLNGAKVTGGFVGGSGTFSTDPTNGAQFASATIVASVTINSNSAADQFMNVTHSGPLNVAPGVNANGSGSTVNFNGFTNQGGGTITIGAGSQVNVAKFDTFGVVNLNGANVGSGQMTLLKNVGSMPLQFDGGSRTFLARVPAAGPNTVNTVAGIDLNGQNAVVSAGLLVNDGFITDTSAAGSGTVMVGGGSLLKGSGTYHVSVVTNGGQFQAGDSIGAATFDRFTLGPGGVNNYLFAINDATGTAGPSPDASGHVSGWGLVKVTGQSPLGAFAWTAGTSGGLTVVLDTLVNPTTVGTGMDSGAALANFDPSKSYSWTAVTWTGAYSGPTDPAMLDAATQFNTGMFASPIAGTFGWQLDVAGKTLSLTYTPTPEPGTFALLAAAAGGWLVWRRSGRSPA
jgi:autotransporter-associated beta strand protein